MEIKVAYFAELFYVSYIWLGIRPSLGTPYLQTSLFLGGSWKIICLGLSPRASESLAGGFVSSLEEHGNFGAACLLIFLLRLTYERLVANLVFVRIGAS